MIAYLDLASPCSGQRQGLFQPFALGPAIGSALRLVRNLARFQPLSDQRPFTAGLGLLSFFDHRLLNHLSGSRIEHAAPTLPAAAFTANCQPLCHCPRDSLTRYCFPLVPCVGPSFATQASKLHLGGEARPNGVTLSFVCHSIEPFPTSVCPARCPRPRFCDWH